ncbi:PAS domain S-box protein [Myxococcota bacterium]|nr:PAS domain S-box protein [Myxococcota bacterium]
MIAAPLERVDAEIVEAQRALCRMLGMQRCSIWQSAPASPGRFVLTHVAALDELPPVSPDLTANDAFPWITAKILAGETLAIPDVDTLPPEAAIDRASLAYFRGRSLLAIPIERGGLGVTGAISFGGTSPRTAWSEDLVAHCRLTAQIVAGVLERKHSDVMRRRAQEESFRPLWRAVEHAPASVVITDADGAIVYVNPKFTEVSGYTLDEVRGRNPRFLKSGHTSDDDYRRMWASISTGREWRGEFHNRKKDGTEFWERAVISALRDDDGHITHFVAVKEDITAEKRAQNELAKVQDQFLHAQKMEAMGRLAGGVAHDFNNLLTVICALTQEVIGAVGEQSVYSGDLREVLQAGRRAAALTKQLLAFSRQQPRQPKVFDLNACVRDAERLLRRVLREDIELSLALSPDEALVLADPGQLDQILVNLAVNARDAMPRGGRIEIAVSIVEVDALAAARHVTLHPGPHVQLVVTDSGEGIPPEIIDRVFEPFFTTKERGRGTGLGLATVLGIVQQSGGVVQLESQVGVGTVVTVLFPRAVDSADLVADATEDEIPHGTEAVLVAEDDAAVRGLLVRLLQRCGYDVLVASHGAEALELAASRPSGVKLLISDVVMPRMSGTELARTLRHAQPDLAVLFTTGFSDLMLDELDALGSGPVIHKPFTLRAVATAVRVALDAPRRPVSGTG